MFDLSTARFACLDLKTAGLSPWFGDRICEGSRPGKSSDFPITSIFKRFVICAKMNAVFAWIGSWK